MTRFKPDLVTAVFLGFVLLCGLTYLCFDLTPSSYGAALEMIGAPEEGPVFGSPRPIRSDEWADATPLLQVCVRNRFQRINQTSFYREDLRNFYGLPLRDWSLVFKPQFWAFFVLPPDLAYTLYYVLWMWAFLLGYFLLFRVLGCEPLLAACVTTILYFCGFTQFWWTSFGCLLGGLSWILALFFAPLRGWLKTLALSYVLPVVCFSFVYPTFFAEFAFAGIFLTAAFRPSMFRSWRDLAALAIAAAVTGIALYAYYAELLPVMAQTWYPGKRITSPGTTPLALVLSQFFPFLAFTIGSYRNLSAMNICECGAVGSFLPFLTLCLVNPRALWTNPGIRRGLILISVAIGLILFWQLTDAPRWLGHILVWDHGNAERLLFISGLLLTMACVLVWREKILSPTLSNILTFLAIGPVASLLLKKFAFHLPWTAQSIDIAFSAAAVIAALGVSCSPNHLRLPLLLALVTVLNVAAFGRFNPLQSAAPIFNLPDTPVMQRLRAVQDFTPGHYVAVPALFGAALNGMGFRSVGHTLMSPQIPVFQQYFPRMDHSRLDYIFNRYAHFSLTATPLPMSVDEFNVNLPVEAFQAPLNTRGATIVNAPRDCSIPHGGAVDRIEAHDDRLFIEGWAPWIGEDSSQGLRVISARSLQAQLGTVKRPDVSESLANYNFNRSGFRLALQSTDHRPIQPGEVVLVATRTLMGLAALPCCGCPVQ